MGLLEKPIDELELLTNERPGDLPSQRLWARTRMPLAHIQASPAARGIALGVVLGAFLWALILWAVFRAFF